MSSIVGIINLDGAPVALPLIQRMTRASAQRGAQDQSVWSNGHVGFGHVMLRTTPEAEHERQPFSLDGRVWITADARVDDRDGLIHELEVKGRHALKAAADVELILHAYHVWGENCVDHLVGDFSFAVWDEPRRTLLCARDQVGIKQLYFYANQRTFIFSSTISAILTALDSPPALNEEILKDYLAGDFDQWSDETAYKDIFPVRPAHKIVIRDHIVHKRYYDFKTVTPTRYRSDEEYAEHFRELFTKVVRSMARSTAPLGLQVSGGVDSSSIASVLNHREKSNGAASAPVILYSYVSKQFPAADEREYLNALIDHCSPWGARLLDFDKMWSLKDYELDHDYLPEEPEIWLLRRCVVDMLREASSDGCRVMLTGLGGDQVLLGSAYAMPSLLGLVELNSLPSELKHFAAKTTRSAPSLLLSGVALPRLKSVIPLDTLRHFKAIFTRRSSGHPRPEWIVGGGAVQSVKETKQRSNGDFVFSGTSSGSSILSSVFGGYWQKGLSGLDYVSKLYRIEQRHPYLNRRVIEFLTSLPPNLLFRQGFNKWVLRQAMAGILPEKIRTRKSCGTCTDLVHLGWRQNEKARINQLINHSLTAAAGWIDQERLKKAWLKYWEGADEDLWYLNAWLNTELWLEKQPRSNVP